MKLDYYTANSLKEKILSGGFWAIFLKLITGFFALIVNILLVRILPMSDVGSYFITHSMVTVFSLVAQFGLPQLTVRLVSENISQNNKRELKENIYSIFIVALFCTLITGLIVVFFAGEWIAINVFNDPKVVNVINLAAFWMVAISIQQIIVESFRGLHDIKMATLFSGALTNIILVVIFIFMLFLNISDYYLVVKTFTVVSIFGALVSAFILSRRFIILKSEKFTFKSYRIINEAWPLWITTLSVFVLTQSDLWIVTYFLNKTDVALYGSSAKLLIVISVVVSLSYAVLPPIISEMNKKGEHEKLQNVLRAFAFGNSLVVTPIFLMIIIFPEFILELFFGEKYRDASIILILLSLGKLFNVFTGIRGYVLILTGYGTVQMKISLIVGGLNIILCTIGAVKLGIIGVAIGAMISMFIQCILELIVVKIKLGLWTHLSLFEFRNLINKFFYEK